MITKVTLSCGHSHVQHTTDGGWWPHPRRGLESLCWERGCLSFVPIVKVEKIHVAEMETSP